MKKILVIGANSTFAKAFMPILAEENTIVTAGRKDCDIYCDIAKSIQIPEDIDVVINFAASLGGTSDDEIEEAIKTNLLGLLNVCKASKVAGTKHIINISSIFALLNEDSANYSIYSITKKQADETAQFYCKLNKIPLTTLRPSRIYGDTQDFAKNQPFLYQIIDKAQNGEDISIYGTNDAARNYIHSADLAEIINRVIQDIVTGTYSCTYTSNVTYSAIANSAQKIFGKGGKVAFMEDKPSIPDDTFPLSPTLYEKINYSPRVSINIGIERIKKHRQGDVS
jgi:nucleoside-diphosphate-sugar epimerase